MRTKVKIVLLVAAVAIFMAVGVGFTYAQAAGKTAEAASKDISMIAIGACLAIALPGVAAAIGLSMATSSIAAAGAERPEIIGKFFIFAVFIEAIAIYGLIVAIFIILMLPGA